jgi:hypothetical protein
MTKQNEFSGVNDGNRRILMAQTLTDAQIEAIAERARQHAKDADWPSSSSAEWFESIESIAAELLRRRCEPGSDKDAEIERLRGILRKFMELAMDIPLDGLYESVGTFGEYIKTVRK